MLLVPAALLVLADTGAREFDQVVAALKTGEAAELAGDRKQAPVLRRVADTLVAAGARPLEGTQDLAQHWRAAAERVDPGHGAVLPGYRDRALGPAYRTVTLPGGGKAVFEQVFLAGQRARVSVVAVSNSDFQLSVSDDDNRQVCRNSVTASRCEWVPAWTTRFNVNILNSGPAAGVYYLVIQ